MNPKDSSSGQPSKSGATEKKLKALISETYIRNCPEMKDKERSSLKPLTDADVAEVMMDLIDFSHGRGSDEKN